ncbi:hypothetical protein U6B65_05070 [Oscillospiraceae bacterium MB08-C2-2]|nr:hypothetical protein U6B65_05070 [Oscillospiraceae bacterium MB08-C2-2]
MSKSIVADMKTERAVFIKIKDMLKALFLAGVLTVSAITSVEAAFRISDSNWMLLQAT